MPSLQAELTRIQNRISRWFNIYFSEYKTVYGKPDAESGMLILKLQFEFYAANL